MFSKIYQLKPSEFDQHDYAVSAIKKIVTAQYGAITNHWPPYFRIYLNKKTCANNQGEQKLYTHAHKHTHTHTHTPAPETLTHSHSYPHMFESISLSPTPFFLAQFICRYDLLTKGYVYDEFHRALLKLEGSGPELS